MNKNNENTFLTFRTLFCDFSIKIFANAYFLQIAPQSRFRVSYSYFKNSCM